MASKKSQKPEKINVNAEVQRLRAEADPGGSICSMGRRLISASFISTSSKRSVYQTERTASAISG